MSKIRFDLREGQGYLQKTGRKTWRKLDDTSLAVLAGFAEPVERGYWSECKSPLCILNLCCEDCSWYYRREWTPKEQSR